METLKREIAMNIRYKDGADPVRVNVEFDMSNLTREQLADWCVNASSLRVNFQNKVRPKGHAYLVELGKTTQRITVQPCGTRVPAELSEAAMMFKILEKRIGSAEEATKYVADYDTVEEAFEAYFQK